MPWHLHFPLTLQHCFAQLLLVGWCSCKPSFLFFSVLSDKFIIVYVLSIGREIAIAISILFWKDNASLFLPSNRYLNPPLRRDEKLTLHVYPFFRSLLLQYEQDSRKVPKVQLQPNGQYHCCTRNTSMLSICVVSFQFDIYINAAEIRREVSSFIVRKPEVHRMRNGCYSRSFCCVLDMQLLVNFSLGRMWNSRHWFMRYSGKIIWEIVSTETPRNYIPQGSMIRQVIHESQLLLPEASQLM